MKLATSSSAALFAVSLFAAMLFPGCADEGKPVHPGEIIPLEECAHFIPSGFRVDDGTTLVYREFDGVLNGEIDLPVLGDARDYALTFFDGDSARIEPPGAECVNHWMEWTLGDSTVVEATANPATKWGVHLRALRDGTTTLRVKPVHDEDGFHHAHFLSREITIKAGDGGAGIPLSGVRLATVTGEIAKERRGAVSGGVSMPAGASSPMIEVNLFGANSDPIDPITLAVAPTLSWAIEDTTIAAIDASVESPASLRVRGKAEGRTSLHLTLTLRDRVEYVSAAIPVVVGPGHPSLGVEAIAVRLNSTMVASWNYSPVLTPQQATGALWLRPEVMTGVFEVEFLGAYDEQAEARDILDPADPKYSLGWEFQGDDLAELELIEGERFAFEAHGHIEGRTEMRFVLRYDGFDEYVSGWLPIEVVADPPGDPDFTVTRNGIWQVIRKGGVYGDACAHTQSPGYLAATAGEITEENLFRLLNDACQRVTPDEATHTLQFEFADRGIAKALPFPEHGHAKLEFHLVGLSAGETTMRIRLLEGEQVVLVTPPIPVRVATPGVQSER